MNARDPISSNPGEPTDEELVARARGGDRGDFDSLIGRFQDRVYNMAYRLLRDREDALDAAQEVFLSVFRGLADFADKARFSTWLYRVTINRCRDELRRRGTVKHTRPHSLHALRDEDDRPLDPEAATPGPDALAQARETEAQVAGILAGLPDEAREVLVLRDTDGLAYDEIAAILGVPIGTVRSRLNRARQLFRERLAPVLGGNE